MKRTVQSLRKLKIFPDKFPSLCKHMKISFYLGKINELLSYAETQFLINFKIFDDREFKYITK